jgi:hypothetical protein
MLRPAIFISFTTVIRKRLQKCGIHFVFSSREEKIAGIIADRRHAGRNSAFETAHSLPDFHSAHTNWSMVVK